MRNGSFSQSKQRGAVLLVALIMLLLLTVLGAAAMRDTNLQERMAGNMRDQSLAFQAAEAALRFAEQEVRTDYANLISDTKYPIDNRIGNTVVPPTVVTFNGFTGEVASKPTYTITRLPHPGQLDMQNMVNSTTAGGDSLAAGESLILDFVLVRIEATGTGASPDSKVTLRSLYFVEE
ncbi:pilus assembly protein PilX [Stutzerimonas zhaodongensis]|uniref:Pilus assembly protein PilX n=1 Tax=Stutzerimonas zhaodongensis TaxID=1176257 RepID=A0A3M2HXF3_9GAMM|nr:PilX N-terminal domain-containing pilus assembly protein [Stutzerimonas zhaodongensis]MCQ4318306.1 PilX N-terminal domain-containing pilus assembly protein [Stutzerimonas zhaodongensis]RMH90504.1 pilus assembly protein PilX [Stutzerimonas zhaodongensis]